MNKHLPPSNVREISVKPVNADLTLEDGVTMMGRCIWGFAVGYITRVDRETFTIKWRDGETTLLRPDDETGIFPADAEPFDHEAARADHIVSLRREA